MKYNIKYSYYKILYSSRLISERRFKKRTFKYFIQPDYNLVKESKLFDEDFYKKQYPDIAKTITDPLMHFLQYGWKDYRSPCANFSTQKYLEANPDVKESGENPLIHYLRIGKKENRPLEKIVTFPNGAKELSYTSKEKPSKNFGRLAILASFARDCKIHDYLIYYIKELKKVTDAIIFVSDNPIIPSELDKIKEYVIHAECKRHNEYDFGSYKRGWEYAEKKGYLNSFDEIIVCNDSCYGPLYPFAKYFDKMSNVKCDFWGMSSNYDIYHHIQSFFYVFRKNAIKIQTLTDFFKTIKKENSFIDVVYSYEVKLTKLLIENGLTVGCYLPNKIKTKVKMGNKLVYPLTLIKDYKFPFIKIKVFNNGLGKHLKESPQEVLDYIEKINPELYGTIKNELM